MQVIYAAHHLSEMTPEARVWQHTLHSQIVFPHVVWSCTLAKWPNDPQLKFLTPGSYALMTQAVVIIYSINIRPDGWIVFHFSLVRSEIENRHKLCCKLRIWFSPRERVRTWLQKRLPFLPGMQWSALDLTALLTGETTGVLFTVACLIFVQSPWSRHFPNGWVWNVWRWGDETGQALSGRQWESHRQLL